MSENREAVVCRCEDISLEEIQRCIRSGCRTINEIKHETRAGMGPCQGRTCKLLIAQELSRAYHIPLEEVLLPAFRVPIEPIPISAMADACEEDKNSVMT